MRKVFIVILVMTLMKEHHQVEAVGEGFIRTRGLHFVLNGNPFFANGFNAYWLMSFASDPAQRSKVSSAFQQASIHGLTVARTWAFSDGGSTALQYSPGSYNEQMFQVSLLYLSFFFFIFFVLFIIYIYITFFKNFREWILWSLRQGSMG